MLQNLLQGAATGAIYSLLALAIVLIYKATRHINLAQGEMATFTTFIAWQLMVAWGVPYWPALAATIVIAFVLGAFVYGAVMHPLRNAGPRFQIGAMIALFLILNSLAGFLWDQDIKSLPTPFAGPAFGSSLISFHRLAMIVTATTVVVALFVFLRRTGLGLRLRAAAENPTSARLVGVRVDRLTMLGWGLAAALGALAGVLIAPIVFIEPQMMFTVFPYAIAAAVLGGLSSPLGAVAGGFILGVLEALATAYLPLIGRELKLVVALGVMLLVLVLRPQGLLGRREVERV